MPRTRTKTTLSQSHPEVAAQWHPTKNGDLTPDQVVAGSHKKAWWICTEGPDHEWETTVVWRARQGSGCPICSGRIAAPSTSLAATHADLAVEWHDTKNSDLAPINVTAGSTSKVWWRCSKDPTHEWESTVRYRGRVRWTRKFGQVAKRESCS